MEKYSESKSKHPEYAFIFIIFGSLFLSFLDAFGFIGPVPH